jgi:hypothetical protein
VRVIREPAMKRQEISEAEREEEEERGGNNDFALLSRSAVVAA